MNVNQGTAGELSIDQNKYTGAGYAAIAMAILFPLSIGLNIIAKIIGARAFDYSGPMVGPGDLLMIVHTILMVYTLLMFRRLLHDRYDFHGLDTLIMIAIWWNIIFEAFALILGLGAMITGEYRNLAFAIALIGMFVVFVVIAGVINILFGLRLLRIKESVTDTIKVLAYIDLVAGIAMVTIILSPLAVLLIPVNSIIKSMIFLREDKQVDFV